MNPRRDETKRPTMTDDNHTDDPTSTGEQGFSELLESSYKKERGPIQVGDRVRGKIISIGRENIFVDTGYKVDGVVERAELAEEDGNLPYQEGDTIDLYVVSRKGGEIRLSRAISSIGGIAILEDAHEKAIPVEGKVLEECKGGFRVEVVKRKAFCPFSQMDISRIEDASRYIGKTFTFIITDFEEEGNNIVLSRRKILEEEQAKTRTAFYEVLETGTIIAGTVSRIMPYGVMLEIADGIEGMIHVSEMSWSRTLNPGDIVHIGEVLSVRVLGIEDDGKTGRRRISLSMKQVEEDPWSSVQTRFKPGDKIQGKVTRLAVFGVFVEIEPGIEGLVHVSEMSYTKRIHKPEEIVSVGDTVDVLIKDIDPVSRRISLSMKEAEGDPWISIKEKYPIGKVAEGTVEKKERYGYFVNLEPGITGLLPKSKIASSSDASDIEKKREGDRITVCIEEIDPAGRRITLAPGDFHDRDDWKGFASDSPGAFGSLGDKLQTALDTKKKKKT
jgi:small subunit ribosomal protein S1